MEEEIDLRKYIEVLLKRWVWIALAGLLAAVVAFIISSILPNIYRAESKVLILRSRTDVSFEPSIRDQNPNLQNAPALRDHQQTLITLVVSSDVVRDVLIDAANILSSDEQTAKALLKKVKVSNDANLIMIGVDDKDPATAAQLANIWARNYEKYVNKLFNGQSVVLLSEVEVQADAVASLYQKAQTDLEQFLSQNEITPIEQDIQNMDQQLNTKYSLLASQFNVEHNILQYKYNELERIEAWLDEAEVVQDQLQANNPSAGANLGNLIALVSLKNQNRNIDDDIIRVQLNITGDNFAIPTPADVDAAISAIEANRARIETDIEQLTKRLIQLDGQNDTVSRGSQILASIGPIIDKKLELEAALEAQLAQERELQSTRDLAWENHQVMQRKLAEVRLDSQITDSQVRLAAHADTPELPASPQKLLITVVAGAIGVFLSVFGVFVIEYWQNTSTPEETPVVNPELAT